jgi:hypothetical protein
MSGRRYLITIGKKYHASTRAVQVYGKKMRAYSGLIEFDIHAGKIRVTMEGPNV